MRKTITVFLIAICFVVNAQMKPYYDDKQGYWGYKDASSGKSIHAGYITAFGFKNGGAVVEEHDRITMIGEEGDVFEIFKYARIVQQGDRKKMFFVNDSIAGEYLEDGTLVKEIQFKEAYKCPIFKSDFFLLKSGNKVGFFDLEKGLVLPVEYETESFWSTFNFDGDLYFSDKDVFCLRHNGKWGITDAYANVIIPFDYEYLQRFDTLFTACKGGKCGLINMKGRERIPFNYSSTLGRYQSGSHIARQEDPFIFMDNGKIIFYRLDKHKVVDKVPAAKYDWERPPLVIVFDQNGKHGAVDTIGRVLIPFEFDYISGLDALWNPAAHYWAVCKDNKCGVYEVGKGYSVQPIECQSIRGRQMNGKDYFLVTKNKKVGLFDGNLKPITECVYDYLDFSGDYISVYSGDKHGKMSVTGEIKWDPVEEK